MAHYGHDTWDTSEGSEWNEDQEEDPETWDTEEIETTNPSKSTEELFWDTEETVNNTEESFWDMSTPNKLYLVFDCQDGFVYQYESKSCTTNPDYEKMFELAEDIVNILKGTYKGNLHMMKYRVLSHNTQNQIQNIRLVDNLGGFINYFLE